MTDYYAGIGSRETPADVCKKMQELAMFLARKKFVLRSGHADGADKAFESGIFNAALKEIWIPWPGFNGSNSRNFPATNAFDIAKEFHPKWGELSQGARKLHARNVHQILGKDLHTPSKFVICWTKDGKASGGTRQAMRIADHYNIPIFNLFNDSDRDKLKNFLGEL